MPLLAVYHVQDRCHRIGQTRPVTVYKLFAEETVDEDIYEMGERKSKLSKAVLQDDRRRRQQQEESGERKRVSRHGSTLKSSGQASDVLLVCLLMLW